MLQRKRKKNAARHSESDIRDRRKGISAQAKIMPVEAVEYCSSGSTVQLGKTWMPKNKEIVGGVNDNAVSIRDIQAYEAVLKAQKEAEY